MNAIKRAAAALLCALLLTGCGQKAPEVPPPPEEIPADYSLEQAKEDGCVVHEDGYISSGREAWDDFLKAASAGKAASVRLVNCYTLDDPSRYDPEYYESVKDDYPLLYVSNLSFDGKAYTVAGLEDGERWEQTWSYLKKFEDKAEAPNAAYDAYIRYVLVNDETVTWEQLIHGALSSRYGDYIPFHSVYTDYIYNA